MARPTAASAALQAPRLMLLIIYSPNRQDAAIAGLSTEGAIKISVPAALAVGALAVAGCSGSHEAAGNNAADARLEVTNVGADDDNLTGEDLTAVDGADGNAAPDIDLNTVLPADDLNAAEANLAEPAANTL